MEVAVVGAGALGTLFGGRLAAAGHDVWLLARRERTAEAISTGGIAVRRDGSEPLAVAVDATTDAAEVGPVDLVLVLVRAHQTRAALADHAACLGPETWVLSLQNGLRNREYLLERVDRDRAFCGVTYEAAVAEGPGTVAHTSPGPTTLGGGDSGARAAIGEALAGAGFAVETVADPRPVVWEKGALVAATAPVLTLTGCPVSRLADDPLEGVVSRLLAEVARVAGSRGIDLDAASVEATVARMADSHADHTVSMVQDVERGRQTEVDELNGAVVDLADGGVAVPANALVTALVGGLERCR